MDDVVFDFGEVDLDLGDKEQADTRDFYDVDAFNYYQVTKKALRMPTFLNEAFFGGISSGTVLDLGCGYGALYEEVPKCLHYIGVDFSQQLIAIGKSINPSADLRLGDICNLEAVVPETADYFLASMVFGHLPRKNLPKALAALAQCLRQGAKGIITSYSRERSYYLAARDLGMHREGGLIQGGFGKRSLGTYLSNAGLKMGEWIYDDDQGIAYVFVEK